MKGGTIQINWHETKPVLTLDFHPLSGNLATGGADFDIKLWSIKPTEPQKKHPVISYLNSLSHHSSAVNVIRFSKSGELLASGADGGDLIIWKLHSTDTGQTWKVLKMLRSHHKDILDLQWSTDSAFLISGSVDNSCIIWDVNKGSNLQTLDAHAHYVQGVAWDPLGKYVASLSSDRTCRIYMNKPKKAKGSQRVNYVCQQVISKAEQPLIKNSKSTKYHLFHDETLPSFFRRLAWSPDGLFLLVPAGSYKIPPASESVNAAYIFSRKDLSRPAIQLPCASKAVVAVRFCPVIFSLRGTNSAGLFKLPYRIIFALATLNSLYIYDTESTPPITILAGLHYAAITDITWSPDAHYLALSSQDGFCTLVEFENDELGLPISLSEEKKVSDKDCKSSSQMAGGMVIEATRQVGGTVVADGMKTEAEEKSDYKIIEPTGNVGEVVGDSRKIETEEKTDCMVIETIGNDGAAAVDCRKTEAEEKDDCMIVEASGNVGAVVGDCRKTETEEKTDCMVIEAIGNDGAAAVDCRKTEAEEKDDCMIVEASGNVGAVVGDCRKTETEEKTDCMVIEAIGNDGAAAVDCRKTEAEEKDDCMIVEASGNVGAIVTQGRNIDSEDKAERQPSTSDSITSEAAEKRPSSDSITTQAEQKAEKQQPSSDGLKTKAGEKVEQQQSSSSSTPISNKPAKKRITPVAIDP